MLRVESVQTVFRFRILGIDVQAFQPEIEYLAAFSRKELDDHWFDDSESHFRLLMIRSAASLPERTQ